LITSQERLGGKKALGLDVDLDEVVLFCHVRDVSIAMESLQERRLRRPASMGPKMVWKVRAHGWEDVVAYVGVGDKSGSRMLHQHFEVQHINLRTHAEEDVLRDAPGVEGPHIHERREANNVHDGRR